MVHPRVVQGLHDAEIGVLVLDVLAHQGYFHRIRGVHEAVHDPAPIREVGLPPARKAEGSEYLRVQPLTVQAERDVVDRGLVPHLDHGLGRDRAEQGDLVLHLLVHGTTRAADQDIREDSDAPQLLDAVLRRLRLELLGRLQPWDERHMTVDHVLTAHAVRHLPDCLEEGLPLDVPHRPADLHDQDVLLLPRPDQPLLDVVGDVGNHLDRPAQVGAPALPVDHVRIDLSGRDAVLLAKGLVDKTLVMPKVQIRLRPVVGDEDLAVLEGVHRPRIHVQIGIHLDDGYPEAPLLQKGSHRSRRDALTQGGDHPARDENVLRHCLSPSRPSEFG